MLPPIRFIEIKKNNKIVIFFVKVLRIYNKSVIFAVYLITNSSFTS